ncbi:Glycosyl hydrolases family 43 [Aeoliella mucimassa]|uniref:Glycosyl hydrolases family 43 n=2 Tax=Aeoliella mucimassa TaxID=2527972 RepID=A0A518AVA1_9BACT|nr:Glycosyl hydrolases family 43 [Aeoliella mucimassa]
MGYVFSYFQGGWPVGGHSGVFMQSSIDGLQFSDMNNGDAVYVPPSSWGDGSNTNTNDEDQARDPSVVYGPDGLFHMVWTSGITTRTIGYASSPDLVNWSNEQLIEIWDQSTVVNHTWAPEVFYDEANANYQIIFASDLDNGDHKLYSITTTDFANYSDPSLYYYNGATVIDAMIAHDAENGQYLMAIKDEQNGQKNIRLATSSTAQGPWTTDNPIIVGPGSAIEGNATEGPSLLRVDDRWLMYYDAYGAGYFGVAATTDADPTNASSWVNLTSEANLPSGHHGTVFAAPISAIFDSLAFSAADLIDDDQIDVQDWLAFQEYHLTDLSGLTAAEQAARGDLNGDGLNDQSDFRLFKSYYNDYYQAMDLATAGQDSFAAMLDSLAVPEPTSTLLALFGLAAAYVCGRRLL